MDYKVGDVIIYTAMGGGRRTVVVTVKLDDVKNERPGFEGITVGTGEAVWGYDSQIVRVVSRS